MAQFDVYANTTPRTRKAYPFLLDVQHDLLRHLSTRTVIPLTPLHQTKPMDRLNPVVTFKGQRFLLETPLIAGMEASQLHDSVGNLADYRDAIVAALDVLFTGI